MSRAVRLVLILYLGSTALPAQTPGRDVSLVPLNTDCPIGIRATLEKGGNSLLGQRLEVTLIQWPPVGIVASRIAIDGFALVADHPQPSEITKGLDLNRIVDYSRPAHTSNLPHASTESKETPNAQGQIAGLDDILGPLQEPVIVRVSSPDSRWYAWVSGIDAVNFIELESVSYADGTTWHASSERACRIPVGSSVW